MPELSMPELRHKYVCVEFYCPKSINTVKAAVNGPKHRKLRTDEDYRIMIVEKQTGHQVQIEAK